MEKSILALKSNFRKHKEDLTLEQKNLLSKLEELYDPNNIKMHAKDVFNKDKLEIHSDFNDLKKTVKGQLFSAFETLTSLGKFSTDMIERQTKTESKINQMEASVFDMENRILGIKGELLTFRGK